MDTTQLSEPVSEGCCCAAKLDAVGKARSASQLVLRKFSLCAANVKRNDEFMALIYFTQRKCLWLQGSSRWHIQGNMSASNHT